MNSMAKSLSDYIQIIKRLRINNKYQAYVIKTFLQCKSSSNCTIHLLYNNIHLLIEEFRSNVRYMIKHA